MEGLHLAEEGRESRARLSGRDCGWNHTQRETLVRGWRLVLMAGRCAAP